MTNACGVRSVKALALTIPLLAAVLHPAQVVAETPRPILELGRHSVFTASETSSLLVRLPKRQSLLDMKSFNMDSEGDGRVTGFMLIEQGVKPREAATVNGLTVGRCSKRACRARNSEFRFFGTTNIYRYIPSGIYRLYVVADGAPVTVTFRASNLSGRVRARPTRRERTDLRTLTPRVDVDGAHSLYSAGDYTDLNGGKPDFGFLGLWVEADAPAAATAWGSCIYYNDESPDPPEDRAFTPGCPEGDSYPSAFPARRVVSTTRVNGQVPYGLGAWYSTTSPVSDYGAVAFWIDF
jgi:hypothetical protein